MELELPFEGLRQVNLDLKNSLLSQSEKVEWAGSSELTYNKDKSIKFDGVLTSNGIYDQEHPYESSLKIDLIVLKLPPILFQDYFKYVPNGNKVTINTKSTFKYGSKELTTTIESLTFDRDFTHIDLKAKATTSYENLHNIDLELKHEVTFTTLFILLLKNISPFADFDSSSEFFALS